MKEPLYIKQSLVKTIEYIFADIHGRKKISIKFKKINQFKEMFDEIKNYKKKSFKKFHSNMIKKQVYLMSKFI